MPESYFKAMVMRTISLVVTEMSGKMKCILSVLRNHWIYQMKSMEKYFYDIETVGFIFGEKYTKNFDV